MKKTKIIIFVTALALLLFANISITFFDGTDDAVSFQLNSEQAVANPETDRLFEMPPDGSDGDGSTVTCYYGNLNTAGAREARSCKTDKCPKKRFTDFEEKTGLCDKGLVE